MTGSSSSLLQLGPRASRREKKSGPAPAGTPLRSSRQISELFNRDTHPEIPVIYTSGQIQQRQRQILKSTFLAKPSLPSDIVEAIERVAA
jgi:hypothetical protein